MSSFYNQLPQPFISLAPMEDVTNTIFRQVIAKAGRPDLFFTEFTNTDSFVNPQGRLSTMRRLTFADNEQPIVAQIWGSKPKSFFETANQLKKIGFRAVDLNAGCPDKAVIKSGGGSDLIRHPELLSEIIKAIQTSDLAVSVKTRLGFSNINEYQAWLSFLLTHQLDALTIHLRTKKEKHESLPHYNLIPEILKLRDRISPQTKITINGGIKNRAEALALVQQYGVDGAMIGRGVLQNPYCFTDTIPTKQNLIELLEYHLDLFDKNNFDNQFKFVTIKKFFKVYINNFVGAKNLRNQLMTTTSTEQARQIIKDYQHGA